MGQWQMPARRPPAGLPAGGMAGRVYQPVAGRRAFGKNFEPNTII